MGVSQQLPALGGSIRPTPQLLDREDHTAEESYFNVDMVCRSSTASSDTDSEQPIPKEVGYGVTFSSRRGCKRRLRREDGQAVFSLNLLSLHLLLGRFGHAWLSRWRFWSVFGGRSGSGSASRRSCSPSCSTTVAFRRAIRSTQGHQCMVHGWEKRGTYLST